MNRTETAETFVETHDIHITLKRLPGNAKAFSLPLGDGYSIVINDALGPEEQFQALEHELNHIKAGHHHQETYVEYPDEQVEAAPRKWPKPYLVLSPTLRADARERWGLVVPDNIWQRILFTMLLTSAVEIEPSREVNSVYHYPPIKIMNGKMYKGRRKKENDHER